jgi:hypothetical protein
MMSHFYAGLRFPFVLVVTVSLWLLNFQAHGATTNWNTNSSGAFTNAANWDNGVPDSDDTAVFNRGFVAYTVTFPGNSYFFPPLNYVIDKLLVRTNEVTFADNSSAFIQAPRLTVANPGVGADSIPIIIGQSPTSAFIGTAQVRLLLAALGAPG